ncbi:MAG: SE1561 family protein [Sporolactobacillus sp.]
MGRATNLKREQIIYLKNRLELLAEAAASLDEQTADAEALTRLLQMMEGLEIKIKRFREDWENHLSV